MYSKPVTCWNTRFCIDHSFKLTPAARSHSFPLVTAPPVQHFDELHPSSDDEISIRKPITHELLVPFFAPSCNGVEILLDLLSFRALIL
ncbi:hypothetical protein WG66_015636, partial [Moniliophthora roreri]